MAAMVCRASAARSPSGWASRKRCQPSLVALFCAAAQAASSARCLASAASMAAMACRASRGALPVGMGVEEALPALPGAGSLGLGPRGFPFPGGARGLLGDRAGGDGVGDRPARRLVPSPEEAGVVEAGERAKHDRDARRHGADEEGPAGAACIAALGLRPPAEAFQLLVGVVDHLHALRGDRVHGAAVGVQLLGQTQVGSADFLARRPARDAQHAVGIARRAAALLVRAPGEVRRGPLPSARRHETRRQGRMLVAGGAVDLRLRQVAGVAELGAGQRCAIEPGLLEIGLIEVGMAQVCAAQIGAPQTRMRQVRRDERGTGEIGADQRRLLQRRSAEVCATEVDRPALGRAELPAAHRQLEAAQVRDDGGMLGPPGVPRPRAFRQLCDVERIGHRNRLSAGPARPARTHTYLLCVPSQNWMRAPTTKPCQDAAGSLVTGFFTGSNAQSGPSQALPMMVGS